MTTRAKVNEKFRQIFSSEIKLHQIDENKFIDFVQDQIVEYSKPDCTSCYDKAYSTMESHVIYCHCQRGQELKKLIEENYELKL